MKTFMYVFGIIVMITLVGCSQKNNNETSSETVETLKEAKVLDVELEEKDELQEDQVPVSLDHNGVMIDGALVCIPESTNELVDIDLDASDYKDQDRLKILLEYVTSGGPPPDGIPPIDEPKYESLIEADESLNNDSVVFVLEFENKVYIFPQNIMVWHEIVNLVDENVALTYCPLTGSAITYSYPDGYDTSFGTSGSLLNSNLVMYDRATETYISQIDGVGLNHDLVGLELNSVPTYWTTWERAKKSYTQANVLTDDTGFSRNYYKDPYGSYTEEITSNYYTNDSFIFSPLSIDDEEIFHPKYQVVGVKAGNQRLAIDPELVKANGEISFSLSDLEHVAVYDNNLDTVRVYIEIDGETINAEYFTLMWFAWYGFYPDTEILN